MRETILLFFFCNSQKGGRSDLSVSQGNPPAAAHKSKKQQNKSKHTNRTPRNKTAIETKKNKENKASLQTLPKAQRTRGSSSAYQSSLCR